MTDAEKSKGFSLRKKKDRRRDVNAAGEISGPLGAGGRSQFASQGTYQTGALNGLNGLKTASLSGRDSPSSQGRSSPAPGRPSGSGRSSPAPPRPQQRPGGATSELVKKRYSVRYLHPPDLSGADAPPIPGVPSLPGLYKQNSRSREDIPSIRKNGPDRRALEDPNLDVEEYATNSLAGASEQGIQEFMTELKKEKNRASTNLQYTVFQNRTQFIKISKEAEKLKGEMRTLRGLMTELSTAMTNSPFLPAYSGLRSPSVDDEATFQRKKNNRSSVANLEQMWNVQLQALWKTIEGSQKFLPAIPGRHVIHETGAWVELDAATWKPRRPAHIVLLNDHLLVATRKRKRVDPNTTNSNAQKAPTKLVAERCWPLQALNLLDLATSDDVQGPTRDLQDIRNAILIRHGAESLTYRSDSRDPKNKADLLIQFKRTKDELRKADKDKAELDERGNKSKETMNYLAARDSAMSGSPSLLRSLSKNKGRPEVLIDVDGRQRNLRWVEGQIDELDIDIALQRFEEAVQRVEQLRRLAKSLKNNTIAQDLITVKVDERARKLADIITRLLSTESSSPTPTQRNTSLLTRLTYTNLARTTYLTARISTVRHSARACIFTGDTHLYLAQLSYIYFTLMKNTVKVYSECFGQSEMSAVVVWARERLEEFLKVLRRGLEGLEVGEARQRVLDVVMEHAAMMGEVGVEFGELVKGAVVADEEGANGDRVVVSENAGKEELRNGLGEKS
ncbi:MAG: exocyst complex component exo84 [Icmadophila ericetorum]|nr:exocyst complex component exo84 [Icmadophila ericetorum]